MSNIHHLKEMILGLAVITPLACQSPPAARDSEQPSETSVTQTDPTDAEDRIAAAPPSAEDEDGAPNVEDNAEQPAPDAEEGDSVEITTPEPEPTPQPSPQVVAAFNTAAYHVRRARETSSQISAWMGQRDEDAVEKMLAHDAFGPPKAEPQGGKCITPKQVDAIQNETYRQQRALWKEYGGTKGDRRARKPPGLGVAKPVKPTRTTDVCPVYLATRIGRPSRCGSSGGVSWYLAAQTEDSSGAMVCCYTEPVSRPQRPCGRLYFVEDRATRARTQETRAWMGANVDAPDGASEHTLERAARAWLDDALEEHASIAAFSRATLELMALGAPADLLAEYQSASLDEIRHARACFALVAALSGQDISAGKIEVEGPRDDLDVIVADVFWGGCVGESIAALCAQRALRDCTWEPARAALSQIAEDEARHAALAWSTLSFLGELDPERVRRVLEAASPPTHTPSPTATTDASWNALGRLTHEQEARAEADAWEHLISPALARLTRGAAATLSEQA